MVRESENRAGEAAVAMPPASDAGLVSIGHIYTPWTSRLMRSERRTFCRVRFGAVTMEAARTLGVNASQAAEAGIAAAVRRAREEAWLKANQAAVDEHSAWLDRHGMPLEPAWPE